MPASASPSQVTLSPGPALILSARKFCKSYLMGELSVHALVDVDLDPFQGELTVQLGASGSGKSTLLNIIGGLDVPTTGRCLTVASRCQPALIVS